ncbi:MAG: hypothetical protein JST61_16420 [Acidobacteria bacterium]|nr:hypothetical protein [Acidobacteriota bacterium]
MATSQEHVAKADNNAAFGKSLDLGSQCNIDWALTALFYSAVHYVDAYLANSGNPPHAYNTHGKRERFVATDSKLKRVNREYMDLKNFGINARYYCSVTKADKVTTEAIPALEAIRNHLRIVP